MKAKTSLITAVIAAVILLLAGRELPAQPLTPEEVVAVMKSEAFVASMNACVQGKTMPATIKLELLINEDGSASLVSAEPAQEQAVTSCFASAATGLKFRAAGQKFKIIFNHTFGAAAPLPAAPGGTLPATPPSAPLPGTITPPSGAQPAPAATPPPAAPSPPPPPPVPDEAWRPTYRQGQAMFGAGIALTAIGGGLVLGMGVYILANLLLGFISWGTMNGPIPTWGVALAVILPGLAVMGTGIGLLVGGIVKKHRANVIKKGYVKVSGFGISPTPGMDGAVLSLALRF